jgi:hypothetical protein
MRICLIDGFLNSFSSGLGRVHGHASSASFVGPRLCPVGLISMSGVSLKTESHHISSKRHNRR